VSDALSVEGQGWVGLDVAPPAPGSVVPARVGELKLVVCNVDGQFYALADVCPHVQVPLSDGSLHGALLECSLHGGRVDVRDGSPAGLPVRRAATTYRLREVDGGLEVDLGEVGE